MIGTRTSCGRAEAVQTGQSCSPAHRPHQPPTDLLVGMRVIHQVLPVILEKLGIDKTFKLDETALRLDRPMTIQWGPDAEAQETD